MKPGPPEYEEGMTTAQPWHSVKHTLKCVKCPKYGTGKEIWF
jgi:hypothetical protein